MAGMPSLPAVPQVKIWKTMRARARVEGNVIREGSGVYIVLEEAASQLKWYESEVVPGLLQAGAYARTLIKADNPGVGRGEDRPGH